MRFSIEDFKQIQKWLEVNGVKDTEFDGVELPFRGDEVITIVQDGDNVQMTIMEFVSQVGAIAGSFAPDGEDLFADTSGFIKLKDKASNGRYDKGYKILRERSGNVVSSSDFLPETIHEIRYAFDLNGGTINIPTGAEILFRGGSFRNGTIIFGASNRPTKLLQAIGDITDYTRDCVLSGEYIMGGADINLVRDMVISVLVNDIEWDATAMANDIEVGPTADVDLEITDI